jgi:Mob1/phocein family protein
MALVQRWISGKIDDDSIFPTDPSAISYAEVPTMAPDALAQLHSPDYWVGKRSGFPNDFVNICKTIFLQMFRVYAHLYWDHFTDFYHLSLEKQLNSCFSHFILTATSLDMLQPEDLEPVQLLIDLWAANDTFPIESQAYKYANLESGKSLLIA